MPSLTGSVAWENHQQHCQDLVAEWSQRHHNFPPVKFPRVDSQIVRLELSQFDSHTPKDHHRHTPGLILKAAPPNALD